MFGTLKCDLHIHSNFSDGKMSIAQIVDFHGQRGYDVIAITDHLCEQDNLIGKVSHTFNYSLSEATFDIYMNKICEESLRAWSQYQMLLIPGYEITKNSLYHHRSAHMLILGITKYIPPELRVDHILEIARAHGALTVAAHPFLTGEFEFQSFHLWSRRAELSQLVDAWEVNYRKRIVTEVFNSGLPLIANSDFHHLKHFESWKSYLFAQKNISSVFQSIRDQKIDFFMERAPELIRVANHFPLRLSENNAAI